LGRIGEEGVLRDAARRRIFLSYHICRRVSGISVSNSVHREHERHHERIPFRDTVEPPCWSLQVSGCMVSGRRKTTLERASHQSGGDATSAATLRRAEPGDSGVGHACRARVYINGYWTEGATVTRVTLGLFAGYLGLWRHQTGRIFFTRLWAHRLWTRAAPPPIRFARRRLREICRSSSFEHVVTGCVCPETSYPRRYRASSDKGCPETH
jgi:hypothetical protein